MDSEPNNVLFCANEIFVLMSCDMILIFSDYVTQSIDRYYLGYFYLSIFYTSVAANILVLSRILKNKIKLWWAERKNSKKVIEEKNP